MKLEGNANYGSFPGETIRQESTAGVKIWEKPGKKHYKIILRFEKPSWSSLSNSKTGGTSQDEVINT